MEESMKPWGYVFGISLVAAAVWWFTYGSPEAHYYRVQNHERELATLAQRFQSSALRVMLRLSEVKRPFAKRFYRDPVTRAEFIRSLPADSGRFGPVEPALKSFSYRTDVPAPDGFRPEKLSVTIYPHANTRTVDYVIGAAAKSGEFYACSATSFNDMNCSWVRDPL
jgi:hypothetical protein